jgi:hypothetical protein
MRPEARRAAGAMTAPEEVPMPLYMDVHHQERDVRAALAQGREAEVQRGQAVIERVVERPLRMAASRSELVAARIHTSTGSLRVLPSRRTARSSMTVRSLPWSAAGSSPSSSRKMVPR